MTNHNINDYFNEDICYPRDKLNNLNDDKYVINSDDSSGSGKHWVALINRKDCIYCDSFGAPPLPEVLEQMKK